MVEDIKIYEPVRVKGRAIKMVDRRISSEKVISDIQHFEEVITNKDEAGFDDAFDAVMDDLMLIRDKETRELMGKRLIEILQDGLKKA